MFKVFPCVTSVSSKPLNFSVGKATLKDERNDELKESASYFQTTLQK